MNTDGLSFICAACFGAQQWLIQGLKTGRAQVRVRADIRANCCCAKSVARDRDRDKDGGGGKERNRDCFVQSRRSNPTLKAP